MILPEARSRLREALALLIDGRMTNGEFDEVYEEYKDSSDRGVAVIAEFGYGLYSSGLLGPYRLRGRHALGPEPRRIAERCLRFLRTAHEYEWPSMPGGGLRAAIGCLTLYGIGFGVIAASLTIAAAISQGWILASIFAALTVTVGGGSYWLHHRIGRYESPAWRRFWATADREAWPFRCPADVVVEAR